MEVEFNLRDDSLKKSNTYNLVLSSIMATFIVISTFISITLPVGGTAATFHLGNITCLLSGILLGPVYGALAAAIGSLAFDLLNPIYIASAPFTVIFKFTMVFICGVIAHSHDKNGEDTLYNILGSASGSLTYIVLRTLKSLIVNLYFLKMEPLTATLLTLNGCLVSLFKSAITVTVVATLAPLIKRKMKSARLK